MKRPMSERQAWLCLAKAWDNAEEVRSGAWGIRLGGIVAYGLCDSIRYLGLTIWIRDSMLSKVGLVGKYRWPLNESGAKARAAFCRKQAAKLTKGKKP